MGPKGDGHPYREPAKQGSDTPSTAIRIITYLLEHPCLLNYNKIYEHLELDNNPSVRIDITRQGGEHHVRLKIEGDCWLSDAPHLVARTKALLKERENERLEKMLNDTLKKVIEEIGRIEK